MAKILIIDDEPMVAEQLKEYFLLDEDKKGKPIHEVQVAENGADGWKLLQEGSFDLAMCDIKMPGMDGEEVMKNVQENGIETVMIMISGHADLETAVSCMRMGAYDFLSKPIQAPRLHMTVRNAFDLKSKNTEIRKLKKQVTSKNVMIGESEAVKELKDVISRVATTDRSVLITGENGTGKEIVAKQIYEMSDRRDQEFIEVNCAGFPDTLIESELFGHVKGAFTGADSARKGKFELANNGTLFLDEIGDMSLSAQAKVLKVLQDKEVTPVGGNKPIKVDVRIITATNRDLKKMIEDGEFREDLYHRISVLPIHVLPLRERTDDIELLVDYFCKNMCKEEGLASCTFEKDAIEELKSYKWTGNVRELKNVVERLIILCPSNHIITKQHVQKYAQVTSIN